MGVAPKKPGDGDREQRFTAVVQLCGVNPYVEVPERVVRALGGGKNPGPGPGFRYGAGQD